MIASRLEFIRLLGEINDAGGIYHYGDVADPSHVLNQAGTECQIGERVGNLIDSAGNVWLPLANCEAYLSIDTVYNQREIIKLSREGWYLDTGASSVYAAVAGVYSNVFAAAFTLTDVVNVIQPIINSELISNGNGFALLARQNFADRGFQGSDSRVYSGTSAGATTVSTNSHRLGGPNARHTIVQSITGTGGSTSTRFFGSTEYRNSGGGDGIGVAGNRDRLTIFCSQVDTAAGTSGQGEAIRFKHFGVGNGIDAAQSELLGQALTQEYPTTSVVAIGDSRVAGLLTNGTFNQLDTIGATFDIQATSGAGLINAGGVSGVEELHIDTLIADGLQYDYMVIYAGVNRVNREISNADNVEAILRIIRKVTVAGTAARIILFNDTPNGQFGEIEDEDSLDQQEWSRLIGDHCAGIDNVEIVDSWGNTAQGRSSLWQEDLSNDGVHLVLPLDSLGGSSLAYTRLIGEAMRIINDPTRKLRSTFVRPETHWQTEDGVDKAFKDGDKVRHDLDVAASAATDVVVNTVTKVV